jgi:hypothetical protein
VKVDHCICDNLLPKGETGLDNGNAANGINVSSANDVTTSLILTDNVMLNGARFLYLAGSSTVPSHGVVIRRNTVTGLHSDDSFHTQNFYDFTFENNISVSSNAGPGAHPDHWQCTLTTDDTVPGPLKQGRIAYNMFVAGNTGINPATGMADFGFRQPDDGMAQGFFFDRSGNTTRNQLDMQCNTTIGTMLNSVAMIGFTGGTIDHMTMVRDQSVDFDLANLGGGGAQLYWPGIGFNACSGITVSNSVLAMPVSDNNPVSPVTLANNYQTPKDTTAGGQLPQIFANPQFGGNIMTFASMMAAYACLTGNPHTAGQGIGGSDIGAVNQEGGFAA